MDLSKLEILLLEAKTESKHSEFVILGSLSALRFDSIPEQMVTSIDVDLYLKNDPGRTETLKKNLGEGSDFEIKNGFYLDPVSPRLASFPEGWEERLQTRELANGIKAHFVDINDVATSKYIRGEPRDRKWIDAGIKAGLIDLSLITNRISTAPTLDNELEDARARIAEDQAKLTKNKRRM